MKTQTFTKMLYIKFDNQELNNEVAPEIEALKRTYPGIQCIVADPQKLIEDEIEEIAKGADYMEYYERVIYLVAA